MTSWPAKQVTQRAPACSSSAVSDNTRQGWKSLGRGGQWHQQSKVLASKADPQVWPPGTHMMEGRVDSCEPWHTSAFSQTHREPKKKGVKGGSRVPKPGKGCCRHGGFSSSHSEHTPQETSQARLHNLSVRLARLHLTWVRQDVQNVHITQSSPGLVKQGQGLVYTDEARVKAQPGRHLPHSRQPGVDPQNPEQVEESWLCKVSAGLQWATFYCFLKRYSVFRGPNCYEFI